MLNVYQDLSECIPSFIFGNIIKRAHFVKDLCIILEFSTFKCIKMKLYLSIVMNVSPETKLHDRFFDVVL